MLRETTNQVGKQNLEKQPKTKKWNTITYFANFLIAQGQWILIKVTKWFFCLKALYKPSLNDKDWIFWLKFKKFLPKIIKLSFKVEPKSLGKNKHKNIGLK